MANGTSSSSPSQNSPEPRSLLYILASAFLGVLFGLFLSKFRAPYEDRTESIRPQDTPNEETCNAPRIIASDSPPTPTHEENPNGSTDKTPMWKKWVEIGVAVGTLGLLGVNILLWHSTKKTADAADQSAKAASRQLEMIDRPWLKEIVRPNADFLYNDGGFSWAINVQLQNVGHSVATGAFVAGKLIAANIQNADLVDGPANAMNKFCDTIASESPINPRRWGVSVFPGDIDSVLGLSPILFPNDIKGNVVDGGKTLGRSIFPILIGCVDYQYSASSIRHQTRFIYDVFWKDPSTG
jgi:hypothetical protein